MSDVDAPGNCPYGGESEVRSLYLAGGLADAEARAFETHYFDCSACAEAIEVGTALRKSFGRRPVVRAPAARTPPIARGWLALAAAAAVALVALGVLQIAHSARVSPPSVDRGGPVSTFSPRVSTAPAGGAIAAWTPVPRAERYVVRVLASDGRSVWSTETRETRAAIPANALLPAAGRALEVQVEALDVMQRAIATSQAVPVPAPARP